MCVFICFLSCFSIFIYQVFAASPQHVYQIIWGGLVSKQRKRERDLWPTTETNAVCYYCTQGPRMWDDRRPEGKPFYIPPTVPRESSCPNHTDSFVFVSVMWSTVLPSNASDTSFQWILWDHMVQSTWQMLVDFVSLRGDYLETPRKIKFQERRRAENIWLMRTNNFFNAQTPPRWCFLMWILFFFFF